MPEAFSNPIHITRPLLPALADVQQMIETIWSSGQLSNNGEMVRSLEKEMADYLAVDRLSVFANGTIALELACKVLDLTGEVITTPFTFAATVHSLALNGLKPVFCDIEEDTFNLDPELIESLITPATTAILPVHVFGNPCKVERIQQIADKYGIKVLYDAAHAFGVKIGGRSLASFGDISMLSLHATKLYHTIEGGALVFSKPDLKERADALRNFGIQSNGEVAEPGTNGKMHEVEAAVGRLLLKQVDQEIDGRREVTRLYHELLQNVPGILPYRQTEGIQYNYPYFVIRVDEKEFGLSRDSLFEKLMTFNVISRKYFYPLCSNFQCYRDLDSAQRERLPVANRIADSVLALPLHGRMAAEDVERICAIIASLR